MVGILFDRNGRPKRKLFEALNKHGIENWSHEVLFGVNTAQEILDKEIEFIDDSVKTDIIHLKKDLGQAYKKMRESQTEKHAQIDDVRHLSEQ